jgi:hypothetical protein
MVMKLTIAVVAAAAVLVVPAGAATATKTKFVSKLYGYSIVLNGGSAEWSVSYAEAPWSTGPIEPGFPSFDTYTQTATERAYVIGSRDLQPESSTLKTWTRFVISKRPPHCHTRASRPRKSTLAGMRARVFAFSCTDGYRVDAVTALHAGHGYFVFVASPTELSLASDRRAFNSARRSFRFLN